MKSCLKEITIINEKELYYLHGYGINSCPETFSSCLYRKLETCLSGYGHVYRKPVDAPVQCAKALIRIVKNQNEKSVRFNLNEIENLCLDHICIVDPM